MNEKACCANIKEPSIADCIQRETVSLQAAYEALFRIGQMIRVDNKVGLPEPPQPSCMRESVDLNYALAKRIEETAHFIYNELFGG